MNIYYSDLDCLNMYRGNQMSEIISSDYNFYMYSDFTRGESVETAERQTWALPQGCCHRNCVIPGGPAVPALLAFSHQGTPFDMRAILYGLLVQVVKTVCHISQIK